MKNRILGPTGSQTTSRRGGVLVVFLIVGAVTALVWQLGVLDGVFTQEEEVVVEGAPVRRGPLKISEVVRGNLCLLYTSPSPRDQRGSRMPSSA